MFGSPRARALHGRYPAIDLHADTLMWARSVGYDMARRHRPPLPRAAWMGHVDLPRLAEGGVGAQFLGLVAMPYGQLLGLTKLPWLRRDLARVVEEQVDALDALVAAEPGRARKARTAEDVERCAAEGCAALLLGLEGAHPLKGDLGRLERLAARGVRYLGLLHFSANEAGRPAFGKGRDDSLGLTAFGRDLVRACEALGVIVDLAHTNRRGFVEACELARKPVVVSHTGVAGVQPHWRNIDDEQLRAVARTGGAVGVIFAPTFLGADGIGQVVRHVLHIARVAGEDTPALGSDWDGMIVPTRELRDAAHLPLLTDALLEAGLGESQVAKVLRLNALRVLESCPVPG